MKDIGTILNCGEEQGCPVLILLLTLLDEDAEEELDVYLLQSESQQ